MKKIRFSIATMIALTLIAGVSLADTVKVALTHGYSGHPFKIFSEQYELGFRLGMDYATNGTMTVNGHKIVILKKDTKFKPDIARSAAAEAFGDDGALFVIGGTSSGVTKSMVPVAAEYKKILIIGPAVADSLVGPSASKYVFKSSRNSSHDMQAQAIAMNPDENLLIATLAEDYSFGREGIKAFKKAMQARGAKVIHEEYVPQKTQDFTAPVTRMMEALKKSNNERKAIFVYIAGGVSNTMKKVQTMRPERYGIELAAGGHILPVLKGYKKLIGMQGASFYFYTNPDNALNDYIVRKVTEKTGNPPDAFTPDGFNTALAIVKAIKTSKSLQADDLIKAMEGMSWYGVSGKITFRKEDHQALHPMWHFKVEDKGDPWAHLTRVRKIMPSEMDIPLMRNLYQ